MSGVNKAITGPLGHWLNVVMFGVICFFASHLYTQFDDLQKAVIQNMSDDRVREYRIQVLETITKPK